MFKIIKQTATVLAAPVIMIGVLSAQAEAATFSLLEATVADINEAFDARALTSQQLVQLYLNRIEAYDKQGPSINSIITINLKALETAAALDLERQNTGHRSPLHGIPVILKDNFDTFDLPTTGGSLALQNSIPPDDAFLVKQLRDAGAVIIAKSNLTELARGGNTISSLGGQTLNPYDLGRTPGGSSGGTGAAIAANFGTIGTGSDTGQSVRSPASANSLVGIRPTSGLLSRDGIIPNANRETAGPITRTVTDTAIMLDVLAGFDPADPVTESSIGKIPKSYTDFLDANGLKGARIGVVRNLFGSAPINAEVNAVINAQIEKMASLGATISPITIPNFNELSSNLSAGLYESKDLLNDYFASLGPNAPIKSLEEFLASGKYDPSLESGLRQAQAIESPLEEPEYTKILQNQEVFEQALLKLMDDAQLDALVYPHQQRLVVPVGQPQVERNGILASGTGFPAITVPGGFSSSSESAPIGVPIGIEFFGRPFSEPTLIKLAYSYEQATMNRLIPTSVPSLPGETFEYEAVPEPSSTVAVTLFGLTALGLKLNQRRKLHSAHTRLMES